MVDFQKVFSIMVMCSSLAGSLMDTQSADSSNWQMDGFQVQLMSCPEYQSDRMYVNIKYI